MSIVQGSAADCSRASIVEILDAIKLPLIIEFRPGVKEIKGISLEMGTIGNHTLCYRAVLQEKVGILQANHCSFSERCESSSVGYKERESYDKAVFSLFYYLRILYFLLNAPAIEGRRLLPSY